MSYYFVSQWTTEPMVHIFPHWNWPGKQGQTIDVWCYSNCDQVELSLNGKTVGSRSKPPQPLPWKPDKQPAVAQQRSEQQPEHLSWRVPYQPGVLRAVGKQGGQVVCACEIHTAGPPARIRLRRMMTQFLDQDQIAPLVADGRDVVVLKAEMVDQDGHVVPTADNVVRFALEGKARIIGVGNGNITSHESNKGASRKAYNGACMVIVQSTAESRQFSVIAASPPLASSRITLHAVAPKPVSLALVAEPVMGPFNTDRTPMVTAEIRDRWGVVIPTAQNVVTFKIEGPATFDHGGTMTTVNPKDGKATAKIALQDSSGVIRMTTHAAGLAPARTQIQRRGR